LNRTPSRRRVLAVDVRAQRIGFALFEEESLIDWGGRIVRPEKVPDRERERIDQFLIEYSPEVLVLRTVRNSTQDRQRLTTLIAAAAARLQIRVESIGSKEIKRAFAVMHKNKYSAAAAVAERFPALAPLCPLPRKIWQSEPYRVTVFDAAALGLAHIRARKGSAQSEAETASE